MSFLLMMAPPLDRSSSSSSWDFSDEDDTEQEEASSNTDAMEHVWRYVKKPLLRIGSKGATASHGNSLRQLLEAHTVVKVKINDVRWVSPGGGSLEGAFETLRDLAVKSGADADMELLQARTGEKTILIGLPGTRERIRTGDFPPQEEL
jgi:hypothetical protein